MKEIRKNGLHVVVFWPWENYEFTFWFSLQHYMLVDLGDTHFLILVHLSLFIVHTSNHVMRFLLCCIFLYIFYSFDVPFFVICSNYFSYFCSWLRAGKWKVWFCDVGYNYWNAKNFLLGLYLLNLNRFFEPFSRAKHPFSILETP